jgi:hypothetical protein
MTSQRIHSILEAEGALSKDLFCTVHSIQSERLATVYSSHPWPEPLGSWQKLSRGIVGEAATKAQRVRIDDVRRVPNYVSVYQGVRSELAIPVVSGEIVTGVVNFESTHSKFFLEDSTFSTFLKLAAEIADYFYFPVSSDSEVILVPEHELVKPQELEVARLTISDISSTLLANLAQNNKLVYELTPRDFEKLVARLLSDQGYTVQLTPAQKDGGYDILARIDLPAGPILTLVECKKYAPENPVTVEIVRGLYGVLALKNATNAMIATTSYFTKDAKTEQSAFRYRLSLKDFKEVQGWLRPYFNFYGAAAT